MNEMSQPASNPKTIFSRENSLKLILLCFAVWLHAASSLLAATTLPSAVREFGGGNLIGWAFSLYLLGSILAGSSTGTLVRLTGLRVGLGLAGGLYLVGSMICALAPDMNIVLAGRFCQGIGGGYLVALAYVAIRQWFDSALLPKVLAMVSAIWSMSAFAGPMVGGTFATFGNWRMAFVAVAVQAAVFIVLALVTSPKLAPPEKAEAPTFPLLRLSLISLSVLAIAFAGAEVELVRSTILCLIALVLFSQALRLDSKQKSSRMFPSKPLTLSNPIGAGLLLILTASIASMSFMVYGPIMLETIHEISPLAAGYVIAFESVCWGGAAVIIAWFKKPNEKVLILLGTGLLNLALIGFALMMESGSIWAILAFAGLQGAGFGVMWAFVVKRITEHTRENEADETASAIPTMQQVGFAFGAAAAGIVANSFGFGEVVTVAGAQAAAFWIFIAFVPFSLIAWVAGWRLAQR